MPKKTKHKAAKKKPHAKKAKPHAKKAKRRRLVRWTRRTKKAHAKKAHAKKGKRKASPAQLAQRAKFSQMAAFWRGEVTGEKVPSAPRKRAGTKKGKKIVKAVERREKKAEKNMSKAQQAAMGVGMAAASESRSKMQDEAKRAARKLRKYIGAKAYRGKGKMHGPELPPGGVVAMQVGVAAKKLTDKAAHDMKTQAKRLSAKLRRDCVKELKAVKKEAETTFKTAFAKAKAKHAKHAKHAAHPGAAAAPRHKKPKHRKPKHPKAKHPKPKHPKPKHPKAPKKGKHPKRKHPKAPPSMVRPPHVGPPRPSREGRERLRHLREPQERVREVTARDLMKGAQKKVKGHLLDFWACAGPVRSGCGSSGHVVRGLHEKTIPAIRLRPGAKEVVI